jgi:hypothetical protein
MYTKIYSYMRKSSSLPWLRLGLSLLLLGAMLFIAQHCAGQDRDSTWSLTPQLGVMASSPTSWTEYGQHIKSVTPMMEVGFSFRHANSRIGTQVMVAFQTSGTLYRNGDSTIVQGPSSWMPIPANQSPQWEIGIGATYITRRWRFATTMSTAGRVGLLVGSRRGLYLSARVPLVTRAWAFGLGMSF